MEKHVSGNWSFFTGTDSLDAAERAITKKLASKPRAAPHPLQRDSARRRRGVLRKWLITQRAWSTSLPIGSTLLADEQIRP
jgi:hypothetical protein